MGLVHYALAVTISIAAIGAALFLGLLALLTYVAMAFAVTCLVCLIRFGN